MVAEPGHDVLFLNSRVYSISIQLNGTLDNKKTIVRENDQIFLQNLNVQSLYHLLLTKVYFFVLAINKVIEYG